MDFPLPIRSVTTVDCFTPLHVDTNIEYTLDMEKFPELNDPLHHWEPTLVIESHNYAPSDLSLSRLDITSSPHDLTLSDNHEELLDLIDTYAIEDLQEDDLDFGFVDLAPSSLQSALDTTGVYLESSFTCDLDLSVSSIHSTPQADDSGFVNETGEECDHENISEEITNCGTRKTAERFKRKRCVSALSANTNIPDTTCKRRKLDDCRISFGTTHEKRTVSGTDGLLNTLNVHTDQASLDMSSRPC